MGQSQIVFALILIFLTFANAVPVSMTFYTNKDFSGQSVTFQKTNPNTQCVSELLGNFNSVCYTGYWAFVSTANLYSGWLQWMGPAEHMWCSTTLETLLSLHSVTRLGPEDVTTPAIAFVATAANFTVIEKVAEANIFVQMHLVGTVIVTYGSSSWTLFEGTNFEGRSACMSTSSGSIRRASRESFNIDSVGSVIRSCNLSRDYIDEVRQKFAIK